MSTVKFSSKMDEDVLQRLRAFAEREGRSVSSVLTEATAQYLDRSAVRPAFRDALREVMDDHGDLLERLAR